MHAGAALFLTLLSVRSLPNFRFHKHINLMLPHLWLRTCLPVSFTQKHKHTLLYGRLTILLDAFGEHLLRVGPLLGCPSPAVPAFFLSTPGPSGERADFVASSNQSIWHGAWHIVGTQ